MKISMYNEQQKLEYISQEKTNEKILTSRFKQFAQHEESHNKDLCEMSVDELKSVFAALNIVTPQTRLNTKSLISGYIDWCIQTKKTNKENALKLLSVNDIASPNAIKMKMLESPIQVEKVLNTIFSSEYCRDYPNKAILSKLIFWLFYSGVPEMDIQVLKKNSIIYDKKIIISPTQNNAIYYEVFDEVIPLWKAFVNIDEIEYEAVGKGFGRSNKLVNNDYLFRQFDNKKADDEHIQAHVFRSYLRRMFVNYQEETGIYLLVSATNMSLSSFFYRLYISGKTDKQIRKEISTLCDGNRNKASGMFRNFLEWRSCFYGK